MMLLVMTQKFDRFDRYLARKQAQAHATIPSEGGPLAASPATRSINIDAEMRRDLQIRALHEKILDKIALTPERIPEFLEKLEQRKLHGRIRHGEYLFWYCALSQWQDSAMARASLLSMEPGPRKYRRRTLLVGVLTEDERLQVLAQSLFD